MGIRNNSPACDMQRKWKNMNDLSDWAWLIRKWQENDDDSSHMCINIQCAYVLYHQHFKYVRGSNYGWRFVKMLSISFIIFFWRKTFYKIWRLLYNIYYTYAPCEFSSKKIFFYNSIMWVSLNYIAPRITTKLVATYVFIGIDENSIKRAQRQCHLFESNTNEWETVFKLNVL